MTNKHNRLYWSCRRGMLELDLMLIPFLTDRYATLTPEQQQQFSALLESTDMELFAWLTGKGLPEDPDLAQLVTGIRAYAQDPNRNRQI